MYLEMLFVEHLKLDKHVPCVAGKIDQSEIALYYWKIDSLI